MFEGEQGDPRVTRAGGGKGDPRVNLLEGGPEGCIYLLKKKEF